MKRLIKIIFCVILFITGCEDSEVSNYVPVVTVNINIYVTDPLFINLNVVGGWEYIYGGSRGILIYRKSIDEFVAFDRHCTYDIKNTCGLVEVDNSTLVLTDSCCMSQFVIIDGSVSNGPASLPLKQYNTSYSNNLLRIYN